MNLPDNYLEVTIKENRKNNLIGNGILNVNSESNCLFLFCPDHTYEYTQGEVKELFELYNPEDGFKYDLNKILQ